VNNCIQKKLVKCKKFENKCINVRGPGVTELTFVLQREYGGVGATPHLYIYNTKNVDTSLL
jgi:hypothetical protein